MLVISVIFFSFFAYQAAHLLQAPKNSHGDINSISSACYKLNSVQLRALLENYRPAADELDIPRCVVLA